MDNSRLYIVSKFDQIIIENLDMDTKWINKKIKMTRDNTDTGLELGTTHNHHGKINSRLLVRTGPKLSLKRVKKAPITFNSYCTSTTKRQHSTLEESLFGSRVFRKAMLQSVYPIMFANEKPEWMAQLNLANAPYRTV